MSARHSPACSLGCPGGGAGTGTLVPFPADFLVEGGACRVPPYETTKEVNVKERWRGRALEAVLAEEFALSAAYVREAAAARRLLVNRHACQAEDILENGDLVSHTYTVEEPPLSSERIAVLAENEHLVVVQKPAGMPCHPQGKYQRASLTELLKSSHLDGDTTAYLHPINRLDRATSGVVLLAKTRKAYMLLARELNDMQKIYIARVRGELSAERAAAAAVASGCGGQGGGQAGGLPGSEAPVEGLELALPEAAFAPLVASDGYWAVVCCLPLRIERHKPGQPLTTVVDLAEGKPATTRFRLLHVCGDGTSLVLCRPATGRTHQIRVHLAALGLPIVGDALYGDNGEEGPLCLHAAAYGLRLPTAGGGGAGEAAEESLCRLLPPAAGAAELPPPGGLVVYRCCSTPAWVRPGAAG